jgi:hypothetical protein
MELHKCAVVSSLHSSHPLICAHDRLTQNFSLAEFTRSEMIDINGREDLTIMKNSIWAALLAVAFSLVNLSSYGQGSVSFQNYDFGAGSLNAPVTYWDTGIRVGKDFTADLLYSLDGGATYTLLTASQAGSATYPTPFAFGIGGDGDAVNYAGYFFGNPVTIPGYTSGPVTFIVEAWKGGPSYTFAQINGRSAPFTEPSLATGVVTPNNFTGLTAFTVGVPEPSIFALCGLGAAALTLIRRKK